MTDAAPTAVVVGATGLVGRACVRQLAATSHFARVTTLTRRASPADTHAALVRNVLVDFERPEAFAAELEVSHVFCALGSTRRAAGSDEAFRRVDVAYPTAVARTARRQGVRHFLVVSSVGASPHAASRYLRQKAELEDALGRLDFKSLTIVRPSVLRGARTEFRFAERMTIALSWALPESYRAVDAEDVASVMVRAAIEDRPGMRTIENVEIIAQAGRVARGGAA
jgi:uncharacterized protein YbjT (DUF2867 family)